MDNTRESAAAIIDMFEELLAKHGIKIPDECREDENEEACIYGQTYYNLEDRITEYLKKCKESKE